MAGKTGTAEWARKRTEHAWFVGFSPYDGELERRLAIAVVLTEAGTGGSVAAPAAAQIMNAARTIVDKEGPQ
jgi:peptidoglycan glycosyltransferase